MGKAYLRRVGTELEKGEDWLLEMKASKVVNVLMSASLTVLEMC